MELRGDDEIHAAIFIIADKYDIRGLRDYAASFLGKNLRIRYYEDCVSESGSQRSARESRLGDFISQFWKLLDLFGDSMSAVPSAEDAMAEKLGIFMELAYDRQIERPLWLENGGGSGVDVQKLQEFQDRLDLCMDRNSTFADKMKVELHRAYR